MIFSANGAVHGPHHVAKEWADKYKGQLTTVGAAAHRERVFERAESARLDTSANATHATSPYDGVVGQTAQERVRFSAA